MHSLIAKTRSDAMCLVATEALRQKKAFALETICLALKRRCETFSNDLRCAVRTAWMLKACYNPTSQHMDDQLCDHLAPLICNIQKLLKLSDEQAITFVTAGLESIAKTRALQKEDIELIAREGIRMLMEMNIIRTSWHLNELEVIDRAELQKIAKAYYAAH